MALIYYIISSPCIGQKRRLMRLMRRNCPRLLISSTNIDLFLGIAMPIVPVIEDGAKTYNIGRRIQEYKSASVELHSSPQPSPMPNLHQPRVELSDVNRSFLTGLSPGSTPQTVFVTFLFDLSFWAGSNTCSTARSSLGHPLASRTTPEIN
jgi:hypothetical protein